MNKVFLILLFVCTTCFAQIQPEKKIYKSVDGTDLYLHIYNPEQPAPNGGYAAIVFFFGGGWVSGNASHFQNHCQYFASRGILCLAADYRTKSNSGTSPFESVKDGRSAMRWVRKNAKELRINPDKIVAAGGSAGGHVAACTAIINDINESSDVLSISPKPCALILFNPVIDTTPVGYGHEKIWGDDRVLSPVHHVKNGIPPTLIFHGTADTTVPFENVKRFEKEMQLNGNYCKVYGFDDQSHGFFNFERTPDNKYYMETVRLADQFLAGMGLINGQPTL